MISFDISEPINIQDIHRAPDAPGLYVWYAHFMVGEADWHSDYADGNEMAQTRLVKAIRDYSLKFGQQEMTIQALANFSTIWKGVLEKDIARRWDHSLDSSDEENLPKGFREVVASNHTREALVNILNRSFPIFGSPLYIGMAVDQMLLDRLKQHRMNYLNLWDQFSKDKGLVERMVETKNFAERAIKLGFSPDELYCITLSIKKQRDDVFTFENISALITASEWLLNRWTTPTLGRR